MYLSTNNEIVGKKTIKHVGLVKGNTIRARHVGHDFMAGLKNLVGGELKGYTELLTESRREALERMLANRIYATNDPDFVPLRVHEDFRDLVTAPEAE